MEDFSEIKLLVAKLNPIETLGILAFYSGVKREGLRKVSESGLEIIQYLFMITKQEDTVVTPNIPQIIQLIDFSNEIHEQLLASRLDDIRYSDDAELKFIAELARLGVQDYRNWSYVKETIEIIDEMVEPINDYIRKQVGFNLKGFSIVAKHVFSKAFCEIEILFDLDKKRLAELTDFEFLSQLLMKENLYRCISRYCLDIDLLTKQSKIDKEDLIKIVEILSFRLEHDNLDLMQVYKRNTISLRPFIKLTEDKFVIFSISALNSFYMEMLGLMVQGNKKAEDSFNRRRSKYVELKTFEVFKKYFPNCEIYNDYYLDEIESNQKDIIMKYGDVIYLIEVKSNGIKRGLRNAGVLSLKGFLEETIVSAHNQTLEIKEKIDSGVVVRTAKTKGFRFIIDPLKTKKICRLVIMFRDLGGLHTNLKNLSCFTGYLGDDISVMTLTDIMVVFDILSSPSERLDYLLQRLIIEKELDYRGDEIDLLNYYLLNRFDIDYCKYKGYKVLFDNLEDRINNYKMSEYLNQKVIKPSFKITEFWKGLMASIEDSLGDKSRPLISRMYRITVNDQCELFKHLKPIFLDIKYRVEKQAYSYIEQIEENSNSLFRLVVIKQPNLSLFKGDKRALEKLTKENYTDIFVVYLNAMDDGKYAGSLALSKRSIGNRKATPLATS